MDYAFLRTEFCLSDRDRPRLSGSFAIVPVVFPYDPPDCLTYFATIGEIETDPNSRDRSVHLRSELCWTIEQLFYTSFELAYIAYFWTTITMTDIPDSFVRICQLNNQVDPRRQSPSAPTKVK